MKTKYYSFLLRLWASETNEKLTWRSSIESPETGKKHKFANLGDLMDFLKTLTEVPSVSSIYTEDKASQYDPRESCAFNTWKDGST